MLSSRYPFERFTERAKKALTLAQEEAERSHHNYVGAEHLLLGLLREGDGLAARALGNLGIELGTVRQTIESMLGRQQRLISRQAIPTARVKRVVEFSFDEARRMGHSYVGTEHLLLGLLIEGEGIAVQVLEGLGASRDEVRAEIERLLSGVSDETAGQDRQPSVSSASYTEPTQARHPFSGLPPFERLSDRAKTALTLAREEAERSHRNYVGTEHLLLGLLREADGLAARVLGNLGIEIETVRMAIESIVGTDEHVIIQEILLTSRVKKVIEISFVEGRRSRHRAIDTEHLLIEGEGIASRVLADRGVDLGGARGEIVRLAGEAR